MADLPICRLTLFSSGVGFFEHRGSVSGSNELLLPFHIDAINDALKSLVINDPAGSPVVSYQSEDTLSRTLKSLSVNLSNTSTYALLNDLKGAEVEIFAPDSIKGRIMFVEYRTERTINNTTVDEYYLSLNIDKGIKRIRINEISNLIFSDPKINEDIKRAMDLVLQSQNNDIRKLEIKLTGETERDVVFSYVIPTALWKTSYRLDLSREKPFLQGWAIVDNDTDTDWENIELALVTGKPVSFIQKLYEVHRLDRPTVPLSIDGIVAAATYDSGSEKRELPRMSKLASPNPPACIATPLDYDDEAVDMMLCEEPDISDTLYGMRAGSAPLETASARSAGDQFEFTIQRPVSLARQQSAMLPLVEGEVKSDKFLVYSKKGKKRNSITNPAICVELTNNTGMKLPAGPITVYDGGTYAGDALIKFFPEGEKRLISYGEDLSVTGSHTDKVSESSTFLNIDKGFMSLNRKKIYETVYSFRNAGSESKKIIIEHPVTYQATLVTPKEYSEKTHNLYRFTETLPATTDFFNFTVIEERTDLEKLQLTNFNYNNLAHYTLDKNVSNEAIKKAMQKALTLKEKISDAEAAVKDLEENRKKLIEKQERTRKNLEAAGNQSQQGKDYLQRLVKEDAAIDSMEEEINSAKIAVENAKKEYENYLVGLKIE